MLPKIIMHADWSLAPQKRWLVRAELRPDGRYEIGAPQMVPPLSTFIDSLTSEKSPIFLGLDLPLGLPLAYARQIGCLDFGRWLRQLPAADPFYEVAERPEEISLQRPFYPRKPGGTRQQQLVDGLNVGSMDALRRLCDRPTDTRRAAAPLFWTMGAQQVGKAAITGWRDFLHPLLNDDRANVGLWPFEGGLATLIKMNAVVVAEAYPAEFYQHLGVQFKAVAGRKWGKRVQADRQRNGEVLLSWAAEQEVIISPEMQLLMADGFGSAAVGEDQFDAAVGVCGMVNIVLSNREAFEPTDEQIRKVEGWILGMDPAASR